MLDRSKPIVFSQHARDKMADRGATEEEVIAAIQFGSAEPARKGRWLCRKNFPFNAQWRGKSYAIKQVAPIVAEESDRLIVVTVFVFLLLTEVSA